MRSVSVCVKLQNDDCNSVLWPFPTRRLNGVASLLHQLAIY
jgi:hypothetical protein